MNNTINSNNKLKSRENYIDFFKMILVLGMIFSHVLDFFANGNMEIKMATSYFNLISFSGFLFIFGYNSYNAYIGKEFEEVKGKLLKNIYRLIIAFWISGFFSNYLLNDNKDILSYIKILVFLKLPEYAEFLATFAIINVFILIFFKHLKNICKDSNYIILCSLIPLIFAMIPSLKIEIPWINLLIKTDIVSFPLIPYLNLFFIGIYFSKNKPKFNILAMFISFLLFIIYKICTFNEIATRFPISVSYIIGSYFYLYLYYYISKLICAKIKSENLVIFITNVR